jgi:hypothetical protein
MASWRDALNQPLGVIVDWRVSGLPPEASCIEAQHNNSLWSIAEGKD